MFCYDFRGIIRIVDRTSVRETDRTLAETQVKIMQKTPLAPPPKNNNQFVNHAVKGIVTLKS